MPEYYFKGTHSPAETWNANPVYKDIPHQDEEDPRVSERPSPTRPRQHPTTWATAITTPAGERNPLFDDESASLKLHSVEPQEESPSPEQVFLESSGLRSCTSLNAPLWQPPLHPSRGQQVTPSRQSDRTHQQHKRVSKTTSIESLLGEESDKDQIWSIEHGAAAQAVTGLWKGLRVTVAHAALLLLSLMKIVMGTMWVSLPAGIVFMMSGVLGLVAALVYMLGWRCAAGPTDALAVRQQLVTAQVLAVLSIPPSAILDGMYMYGMFRGGLMTPNTLTVVLCAALSVAQSAVFMFVFLEAMETRRLLQNVPTLRTNMKNPGQSIV